jgi:allantoin racemase
MKVLFVNPFGTNRYNGIMERILGKVKRPDTELVVTNLNKGPTYLDYWYYKHLVMTELIEKGIQAEKDGYDGVIFACMWDPGVFEAKECVDIPLIGTHEPTIHLAAMLGHRFALVTNSDKSAPLMANLIRQYGLENKCVGAGSIKMSLDEIYDRPEVCRDNCLKAVHWAKERGADVLVQGCTIQSAYFIDAYGLSEATFNIEGLTVLDPNIIGLKTVEMLVDLKKLGIGLSRNSIFKKPMDFSQKDFGDVRRMFNVDTCLL